MIIKERGTVFKGKAGTLTAGNYIPCAMVLENGALIVCHRTGSSKLSADARIAFEYSYDRGKSWSDPIIPFSGSYNSMDGSLWSAYPVELKPGKIFATVFWIDRQTYPGAEHVNDKTLGIFPVKTLIYESYDDARTWSGPRELVNKNFKSPLPVENSTYSIDDKTLAVPFEIYKNFFDEGPWRQAAILLFSKDRGITWTEHSITCEDKTLRYRYNDQRGAILSNGKMINYYAVFDTNLSAYVNIHMNESIDGGRHFTKPKDIGISGMPSQPVELKDKTIAIANADQETNKNICIWLSQDEGRTWDTDNPLVLYEAKEEQENTIEGFSRWKKYNYGRPQCILLPDGDLFVVYYAGESECTDICYAVIGVDQG